MPPQHAHLAWDRTFTPDEWQRICRGVIPRQMEDKWLIFVEETSLHLHRSWTGYCIYQVQVKSVPEGFAVAGVRVNRDPTQYRSEDKYDLALLDFLISNLLLGGRKPFPLPPGVTPTDTPGMGVIQHHCAGTGYPEVAAPAEPPRTRE